MATLSLSDWLASGQGLPQVPPSQSQYSVGQVCSPLLLSLLNTLLIDYSDLVFSYLLWWQLSSPIHDIGSHIIFNQKLSALGLQYFERFGVCFPCICYITISPALHL